MTETIAVPMPGKVFSKILLQGWVGLVGIFFKVWEGVMKIVQIRTFFIPFDR